MTNKRGRLKSAGGVKTQLKYKCVVKNCNMILRGDRIAKHFRQTSKMDVLDDAKKMDVSGVLTNGLKHIDSLLVDDEAQNSHTKYLLSNGFSSKNLPDCDSYGFKKHTSVQLSGAFAKAGFTAATSKVTKCKYLLIPLLPFITLNYPALPCSTLHYPLIPYGMFEFFQIF